MASPPSWLEVREIAVPRDTALAQLDPGEREAIGLAEALRADALILDEKRGRREAERRNLRVIGTVRVLDDAADAGLLDLPAVLERLQAFGFYLDAKLMQFLLDRHSVRLRRKSES
jgi:predicted nucleic acid-binding protein